MLHNPAASMKITVSDTARANRISCLLSDQGQVGFRVFFILWLIAIELIHPFGPFFAIFFVLDLFPRAIIAIHFKQLFAKLFVYSENV